MIRRTSSDRLAIFAKFSTSDSVSLGLLSTETDTSLFGSRMRMARSSLEPFIAAFIRSATLRSARAAARRSGRSALCPRRPRRSASASRGLSTSTSGSSLASPPAMGSIPRPRKKSRRPSVTSGLPRNIASESVGNSCERRFGGAADLRIAVLGQHRQQRHLLVRPRRERAACGKKPHVLGDFPALEKIEERTAKAEVHQGIVNSCRLDTVIRLLTTSPGAPSGRPCRPFKRIGKHAGVANVDRESAPSRVTTRLSPALISPENTGSPSAVTETQHAALGAISMVSPELRGTTAGRSRRHRRAGREARSGRFRKDAARPAAGCLRAGAPAVRWVP